MSPRDLLRAGEAEPIASGFVGGGVPCPPRDGVELRLVRIWEETLDRPGIGAGDDFFALGGDREAAARVTARIAAELAVELEPAILAEAPTVGALAARVVARAADDPGAWVVDVARDGELPLSLVQERLGPLDRLAAGDLTLALRLSGRLSVPALAAALAAIVERHEALRTTFDRLDGRAVQVIHLRVPAAPLQVDLADLPAAERRAEAARLAAAAAGRPFDLVRGPLFRFLLLRRDAGEHTLLAAFHPLVFDAGSWPILVRELGALYRAAAAGEPSPLGEPPIQYVDFAVWQREWLAGEALEGDLAHRLDQLAGFPAALSLPVEVARPEPPVSRSRRGVRCDFAVPPELTARLRTLAESEGATLSAVLLAAFAVALYRRSGQERFVVGLPVAGRDRPELNGLIGRFANTLAVAADLSGDPPLRALVGRAQAAVLAARAHSDLAFAELAKRLRPVDDGGGGPAVAVGFQLDDAPVARLDLPGVVVTPEPAGPVAAEADLAVEVSVAGEGGAALNGAWVYRAGRFDHAAVAAMSRDLLAVVAALAADPDRRLSAPVGGPAAGAPGPADRPSGAAPDGPAAAPPPPSVLVRLHPGGGRPPLVLVHGAGGGVLIYGDLARRLGEHRPVYAFEAPEPAAGGTLPRDLEEIAAAHADRLRASGLPSPYRLSGWSMGGVLAVAIAQRLLARGEEVALVALFDSWLPATVQALEGSDHVAALWLGFASSLGLPLSVLAAARGRLVAAADDRQRLGVLLAAAQDASLLPAAWTVDHLERRFAFHRAHIAAFRAHRPAAYPGRLLLFQAEENVGGSGLVEQAAAWRRIAPDGLEVRSLPADHLGLLRPPAVAALAAQLEERLERFEAAVTASPPAAAEVHTR